MSLKAKNFKDYIDKTICVEINEVFTKFEIKQEYVCLFHVDMTDIKNWKCTKKRDFKRGGMNLVERTYVNSKLDKFVKKLEMRILSDNNDNYIISHEFVKGR